MNRTLLATLFSVLVASTATGAVYNVKVLSEHVVDLTDLDSFCKSATSRWKTNDEKAAAIGHWFGVLGNQGSRPYEWTPVEPILHFNTSMEAMCANWTALYGAVAEGGMGWVGRHYEVGDHTVPELEYDGKRHYMDNTYKFWPTDCNGRIISITEMDDVAGPCKCGPRCKYHNLMYHTPMALCRDPDGYNKDKNGHDASPIRAWLSGPWLRREAVGRAYFASTLDEKWVKKCWKQEMTEGYWGVYRMAINLREGEHYTRYWIPPKHHPDYYYPTVRKRDPNAGGNFRYAGSGTWVYEPDLSEKASYESYENVRLGRTIAPTSAGTEAVAVFKVQSAHVTTGAIVEATVTRRGQDDAVAIEASSDAGRTWFSVWDGGSTGTATVNENISERIRGTTAAGDRRPILNYLVRVRMKAARRTSNVSVGGVKLTTITAMNRQSLPKLKLGSNTITVDYDKKRQYETLSYRPILKGDFYKKSAVETSGLTSQSKAQTWSCTLYAAEKGKEGHVTYQLTAPRGVTRLRMGGSIWIGAWWKQSDYVRYDYRLNNGRWGAWKQAGKFSGKTLDTPHKRRNQSKYVEVPVTARNVTRVEFRFVFCSAGAGKGGVGANALRMEVDYPAVDATFKPLEVTYAWREYFEPLPKTEEGGKLRTHTERVTRLPYTYEINVGGHIHPRTEWVRVNLDGSSPEPTRVGYSDGKDVGSKYEIPSLKYDWGKELAIGKPYTTSRPPAQDSFHKGGDERELTDGFVKEPQCNGPWPAKTVAHWPAGVGTLAITVDLGESTRIGGARLDAYRYKGGVKFPESVKVQTSTDGRRFTDAGRDTHHMAKYAHNGWPANWPLHPHHDSPRYGEFPDYGLLGNYIFVPFERPVTARYVRFVAEAQRGNGLMFSEAHVYDSLEAIPWTPRLAHEPERRLSAARR